MVAAPCVSGKGRKKIHAGVQAKSRWEPVELLVLVCSSQQVKMVGFSVLYLLAWVFPTTPVGSLDCRPKQIKWKEKKPKGNHWMISAEVQGKRWGKTKKSFCPVQAGIQMEQRQWANSPSCSPKHTRERERAEPVPGLPRLQPSLLLHLQPLLAIREWGTTIKSPQDSPPQE